MSNMMVYAQLSAQGGSVENVWGTKMRIKTIDASDKDAVEQAKADGWTNNAQDVIDAVEAKQMQAENEVMKDVLADSKDAETIKQLEDQLSQALVEVANFEVKASELEAKLAIYEETKDVNGDGVVSYDEMTNAELSTLLKQRDVEHNIRDGKDALIKAAKESEK